MSRGFPTMNYIRALQIMFGKWHSVSNTDYIEEETDDIILQSKSLSAEQKVIRKETWENLSEEAKEVIMAIISAPEEMMEIFKTPKHGNYSKRKIKKHFSKIWHSKFITDLTIQEIAKWVSQL